MPQPEAISLRLHASPLNNSISSFIESTDMPPTVRIIRTRDRKITACADWLAAAARLPGKALALAIAIQWMASIHSTGTIVLTSMTTLRFSISRDASYDGLRRLEKAGLISVQRYPGRQPTITIIAL